MKKIIKLIFTIIIIIIIIYIFSIILEIYRKNFFNGFSEAELALNVSTFSRDKDVRYSDAYSYKIESPTWNDAIFYKTIKVEKNSVYRLSCMVKTKDVVTGRTPSDSGAHISIMDTLEKSRSVTGTSDWQEIELCFNSYDREEINIGFRLGGNTDNCTGTVWFSDFKLEKGVKSDSSTWNVACFIMENTDIAVQNTGQHVNVSMTPNEIYNTKQDMERYKNSCSTLSGGKMSVNYDIYEIEQPLTSVSNDEDNGNFVSGADVSNIIDPYLDKKEYDHIFVVIKLGDLSKNMDIPVNNWIGLGSMVYRGIGFSDIRIPSDSDQIYIYAGNHTFPEEVMIHEFLHDLERLSKDLGYNIPALHDSAKYGYENQATTGLKDWYEAYMRKTILDKTTNTYIGLPAEVYTARPAHDSDFNYSVELEFNSEPKNIFEEIYKIVQQAKNTFESVYLERPENGNEVT